MESKEKLADALEALMDETPLDSIRIHEITERAGVSKQTFYRNFADKYELMEFCFRRIYDDTFGKMGINYPLTACCMDLYALMRQKYKFVRNAYESNDVNNLTGVTKRLVRETYARNLALQGVADEGDIAFALDLVSIGGTELTKRWVLQKMDMSDKELCDLWVKCMPANISPYFR